MADADKSDETPPGGEVIRFPAVPRGDPSGRKAVQAAGDEPVFRSLRHTRTPGDRPLVQPLSWHLVRLSARGDVPGLWESSRLSRTVEAPARERSDLLAL